MTSRSRRVSRRVSVAVLLTAIVVLVVLLGSGTALAAPPWSDATNSWWMSTYGISEGQVATVADGYPGGIFRPGLDVSRAQFAKMAVDGLGGSTASPVTPTFRDVPATNYFYPWIEGGAAAGIISGYSDGSFGPGNNIIRQQANSILGSYLAQKELNLRGHIAGELANYPSLNTWYLAEGAPILAQFADASRVASVHAPTTAYLVYNGVVEGSTSGGALYLGPGNNLNRGQAAALILRTTAVQFSTALPTLTLLNPNSGPTAGGNSVVIKGTNFTDVTSVKFGTSSAAFVIDSSSQITAVAPAGTLGTTVDVTVTTAAGTSATSAASRYTYGLPIVTAINPASGSSSGGTSVVITGNNFVNVSAVKFGAKNAISFVVNSATQITAVAASGTAGSTVDVTVTTSGGTSAASAASKYSYGLPTITNLSPGAGPAVGGNSVVITGTGFTGVSAVEFGSKDAISFVVDSPTQITAVAPSGVSGSTVDVKVSTAIGTSVLTVKCKYSYGLPTISSLNPSGGPATGGTSVIITGTGFTGVTDVTFGSKDALSFVVDSPTQITAVAPSGTSGNTVDVRVTTGGGTSATSSATKYSYGVPTVTSLSPSWGPAAGYNAVTIYGTNFGGATTVMFGTSSASFTYVSTTQLNATAPPGINGTTVNVTVSNAYGTSSTAGTGNDYTYGVVKFAVTMTNGSPLSASSRTAGTTYTVRVRAQDAGSNTITGFTGTVALTSNAWVGTVNAPITSNGYVDVSITPTIAGTTRYITATYDTVVTTNASGNFTVIPGSATKLQVLLPGETAAPGTPTGKTGTATNQPAGTAFTVTVNAVDANWNVVAASDTIHITSSGAGTMPTDADLVNGTKNFSVTLTATGTQTITATDLDPPALTAGTGSVVVAGTFTKLLIILPGESYSPAAPGGKTGTPSAQTAGTTFTITVNACDANWNLVTNATDTVTIDTSDPSDSEPSDLALSGGTRTFSINLHTTPSSTITATDVTNGGITPYTTAAVTVNPAGLDHFGFAAISNQTAGVDFPITITAYDVYNNIKTNYSGSPTLTVSNSGPVTPSTLSTGWVIGVWSHNVNLTKAGTGIHLTVAATPASNNSADFNLAAGPPSTIAWVLGTPTTQVLTGGVDSASLTAVVRDAYGNPISGVGVTLHLAATESVSTSDVVGTTGSDGSYTFATGFAPWGNFTMKAFVTATPAIETATISAYWAKLEAGLSLSGSDLTIPGGVTTITGQTFTVYANTPTGTVVYSGPAVYDTVAGNTVTLNLGAITLTKVWVKFSGDSAMTDGQTNWIFKSL